MADRRIVGFCANTNRPSRTRLLVEEVVVRAAATLSAAAGVYDLFEVDADLRSAAFRGDLRGRARVALEDCEDADALVIGVSMASSGSYPGLLKHFFDLADPECIRNKPVILAATGGAEDIPRLARVQLRLLFRSLGARPVPAMICTPKWGLRTGAQDAALADPIALAVAQLATMLIPPAELPAGPWPDSTVRCPPPVRFDDP